MILTTQSELARLIKASVTDALQQQSKVKQEGKEFLTIGEACNFLNIAKQTMYGYTSKDTIPFIKKGKQLYFRKSELEEWLLSNRRNY